MKTLVCAIAKCENHYIREWVEHYKSLGFTNICLYDNNDVDGEHFEDVIDDYIKSGFVLLKDARGRKGTIEYRPGYFSQQIDCYNECYNTVAKDYDWVFFCDIDEFLILDEHNDVLRFLDDESFDGSDVIKISWKYYDDNGIVEVKDGDYSIKRFTHPNENLVTENLFSKQFIKTNLKVFINSPHGINEDIGVNDDIKCCNVLGLKEKKGEHLDNFNIIHRVCWLNHYRYKTIEEYIKNKMNRRWPDTHEKDGEKIDINTFLRSNQININEKIAYIQEKYMKRRDIQLYEFCHKKVDYINENSLYTPIQVGACNGKDVFELKDNTLVNIGNKNKTYCELTGMYWLWKNANTRKYIGQMTYRRLFQFPEDFDFDDIFSKYDVITTVPLNIGASVEQQYAFCHNINDLKTVEGLIVTLYPNYYDSYVKYIKNGNRLIWANGLIMKREDYDKLCSFLFTILFRVEQILDIDTDDKLRKYVESCEDTGLFYKADRGERKVDYQMRFLGFLAERLITLYIYHNFSEDKIKYISYDVKEEGIAKL